MIMIRYFLILLVIAGIGCLASADPGQSIDRLMQMEISSSYAQLDDEPGEGYDFPLSGDPEYSQHFKSAGKAALYSLVMPGAGQYYVHGANLKAKLFFGLEAGLWLSYFGFHQYGNYKEDAAKGWAVLHAGADASNTDEDYWIKMTYYDNRDTNEDDGQGYNQMVLVNERDYSLLFPETPEYYWNWDSPETRHKYRNLRNESKTAFERADVTLGILLANHLISSIEAFFAASKHNRHIEFAGTNFELKYKIKPNPVNPSLSVSLVKSF